jgi:osmotically-inducible protein OsmY
MYKQFRTFTLAAAISLALISASGSAYADGAQDVANARKESQIWTSYALSPYLRAHDISVSVEDGKATLTGNVAEDVNKELATQIALSVKDIKEVDNQIARAGSGASRRRASSGSGSIP